jgi:uncharacterized protein with HEPN domain
MLVRIMSELIAAIVFMIFNFCLICGNPQRQNLPNIAWQEINGMRNRLVHEYDDVNLNIVWDVIQSEIPSLIEELQLQLPPEP